MSATYEVPLHPTLTEDDALAISYVNETLSRADTRHVESRIRVDDTFSARVARWKDIDATVRGGAARPWKYGYHAATAAAFVVKAAALTAATGILVHAVREDSAPWPRVERSVCDGVREWCVPASGAAQHILLPDTSSVMLQPGASLTFARVALDEGYDRAVVLRGNATIVVNGDESRRLAVFTPRARIDLSPGQFAIDAAQDEVLVRVQRGEAHTVRDLRTYGEGRVLHAGDAARIRDKSIDPNPWIVK